MPRKLLRILLLPFILLAGLGGLVLLGFVATGMAGAWVVDR